MIPFAVAKSYWDVIIQGFMLDGRYCLFLDLHAHPLVGTVSQIANGSIFLRTMSGVMSRMINEYRSRFNSFKVSHTSIVFLLFYTYFLELQKFSL